jgi:hypothetical protein
MRKLIFVLLFLCSIAAMAQELNCTVQVLTPAIQESNKQIYETMQTQIRDFMNNHKWTSDQFLNQERIECSIIINITERTSTDEFKATIQVQSRRPVYKSSYYTPMINHQDNDFTFRYVQDQLLEFDENSITSNLMATLAYYSYIVIAFDYDSFSLEGGTPYFAKAQTIVNNCQNLADRGWKAFESQRNRYWLTENAMNVEFKPLRACLYRYHRLGFDKMSDAVADGRKVALDALKELRKVYNDRPNSFFMQFFFNAKADEIVNLFSQAPPDDKNQAVQLLTVIDPGNINKYNNIGK